MSSVGVVRGRILVGNLAAYMRLGRLGFLSGRFSRDLTYSVNDIKVNGIMKTANHIMGYFATSLLALRAGALGVAYTRP